MKYLKIALRIILALISIILGICFIAGIVYLINEFGIYLVVAIFLGLVIWTIKGAYDALGGLKIFK